MSLTLLIIQIILALFLIIVILLQKSSSEGWSSMASNPAKIGFEAVKSRSNPLAKITAILAVLFMVNCLILANVSSKKNNNNSLINKVLQEEQQNDIGSKKDVPALEMIE